MINTFKENLEYDKHIQWRLLNMNPRSGYYYCPDCQHRFRVMSYSLSHIIRNQPRLLEKCPQCGSENLQTDTEGKFIQCTYHVWFRAFRKGIKLSIRK